MWIYSVQVLTVVPWNGFSSLTCRWRERVPQPDAWGGDGWAGFWWERGRKRGAWGLMSVWETCNVLGESTKASNVRCNAAILTQPPCFSNSHLLTVRACAVASVSSINLHKTELWQLLWAHPQPGCAPLPAASPLFVMARTPGGRITQSIRPGKRDYIRNHTAADEPRVQQAVSEKHLFSVAGCSSCSSA